MSITNPLVFIVLSNGQRMLPILTDPAGHIVLMQWRESILDSHGKLNLHGITSLRRISGQFI